LDQVRDGKSFREFRDDCREAKLRAADDQAMAQRLHETRSVRTWSDGHWCLEARLRPDEGDRIRQVLENKTNELFAAARAAGRREPLDAYRADALVAIMSGNLPTKPIESRLDGDLAAIERGYVLPGERCELEGVGPIPVTIARALLGDAKLVLMVREGNEITKISSPKRGIPIALRRWLERAYPHCGVAGCGQRERLQIDHIVPVEEHGPTSKANTWRICPHHHTLKTLYGYRVVTDENEIRHLVPPDDPDPP
jgi:HNH endonuclease